jgi:hypothetical protein
MIKKLPDGTYDLSDLTKSTDALGWEHISLSGYFPGSDKNPRIIDDAIIFDRCCKHTKVLLCPNFN